MGTFLRSRGAGRTIAVIAAMGTWLGSVNWSHAALDAQVITIGGEVRERYEFRDNTDFNSDAIDTLSFIGSRIRLHLNYEVTPDVVTFIQIQDARVFGSETSTISNDHNLDLHQGYVMVKNMGKASLTLGRQEIFFGDHRLVGHLGWTNTARSFDGLRVTYMAAPVRVDFWAASTKVYGTTSANATNPNPVFAPAATTNRDAQQFFGVYGSVKTGMVTVEPYVLHLLDTGPATGGLTAALAPGQSRTTLGLRVDGKAAGESIDFTGEAAYQIGSMDARGAATSDVDIAANAMAIKAGYTVPAAIKPRIGIEFDRASGDSDSTDDKIETFENLFHTNHMHYGYMDLVGWRNMQAMRVSLSAKPTATSGVSLDYHMFSLAEENDNWYAASGAALRTTPTGNTESDLGQEIDLVGYVMLKEKVRVELGYGRFMPGDYVDVNFPTATDASDWFYAQVGTSF